MPLAGKGIISHLQKEVLELFAGIPDSQHFYLTGGTALAEFYLGHRRSFDLDVFTIEKHLVVPFSRLFEEAVRTNHSVKAVRRFQTFVQFEVGTSEEDIKVELAYDAPFRFALPEETTFGVKVNDFHDLKVDKLLAFFSRIEPRDAIDLYFILQREDFWDLAKHAEKKDPGFDLYWLAVALDKARDFPDDLSRWPVEMLLPLDVIELKKSFVHLSQEVLARLRK